MSALSVNVKRYIVQALACFDTPTEVSKAVKEEYGLDVPRQQISKYDPTKVMGQGLSKELRQLFEETRAKFKNDVEAIPIAQQSFRLRSLAKMHAEASQQGNKDMAARLLEQAAKEIGGAYTSVRRIGNVPGEGPLKVEHTTPLTDDELDKLARGASA